jgi:hypothetical protein
MPPYEIREATSGILSALSAAHARGVFHGTLDAAQVWFTPEGAVKVSGAGIVPVGSSEERAGIRADLRRVAVLLQEMFAGGPALQGLAPELSGPGVDDAWRSFFKRLKGEGEEAFATAEEALESLRAIPVVVPRKPWVMPGWIAGPVLIVASFLGAYVALGMFYLPGFLRILAGLGAAGLYAAGRRGVRHPRWTVALWSGIFWAIAARPLGTLPMMGGILLSLVAAAALLAASRRRS